MLINDKQILINVKQILTNINQILINVKMTIKQRQIVINKNQNHSIVPKLLPNKIYYFCKFIMKYNIVQK